MVRAFSVRIKDDELSTIRQKNERKIEEKKIQFVHKEKRTVIFTALKRWMPSTNDIYGSVINFTAGPIKDSLIQNLDRFLGESISDDKI